MLGTFGKEDVDEIALKLQNVSCFWNPHGPLGPSVTEAVVDGNLQRDNRALALKRINIDLKMNELTFVIGSVGSGKSAFLLALAAELMVCKGTRHTRKSLAYASQEPWIMNGTVKENILMDLPYCSNFYSEVIHSCGLDIDLQQFENADETLLGDQGVQCSGGQVSVQPNCNV